LLPDIQSRLYCVFITEQTPSKRDDTFMPFFPDFNGTGRKGIKILLIMPAP
jgi:hypothetical protein